MYILIVLLGVTCTDKDVCSSQHAVFTHYGTKKECILEKNASIEYLKEENIDQSSYSVFCLDFK